MSNGVEFLSLIYFLIIFSYYIREKADFKFEYKSVIERTFGDLKNTLQK